MSRERTTGSIAIGQKQKVAPFILAFLCAVIGGPYGRADEMPVEILFQRAAYGKILLSPDGLYIAGVVRFKGRNNLKVIDLQKRQGTLVTSFDQSDVQQFYWISNNRLVLAAGDAEEASGIARYYGWYAVDRDGSHWRRLGGFTLLGLLPDGGDDIVVAATGRDRKSNDVYRLNTQTQRFELLSFDTPGKVLGWVVDREGVPRVAHSYDKGIHTLWYRESSKSNWVKIDNGTDLHLQIAPLAFDYDNKTFYVRATRDGDKTAIYKYDVQSKKLGELVAGSSQTNIDALIFSPSKRALVGVSYLADKPGVVWLDADMARLQKTVDTALPNTYNVLQVADENPHRAIVFAYSDTDPGKDYLLDIDTQKLEEIARPRPWIDPSKMVARKPVTYTARDGLEIPAYFTLPLILGDTKPPLVVIIHGGPFARGASWGFNLEAEFFASRGYAVLEPEFRGSDGHGWKLFSAGLKQWGLAMQDDITDGVEWLVSQGLVDKDRICLYGASYGGYATLWGLIKTPGLYKCGVAFVAVTDIGLLFEITWSDLARSSYGFLDYGARELIGDPDKDAEKFRSVSPLFNAEKLTAPVLLAYGAADVRVPLKHGQEFRAALDKYGKTYEWVVYDSEGHGFNKDENRFDFYRRVDAFLKKYLAQPSSQK